MIQPERIPLLLGEGRFVDDIPAANAAHAAFVRSPHAHAGIARIEVSGALESPGVVAILTGESLKDIVRPIRAELNPPAGDIYCETEWHPIAHDRVRYVGEIVAAVFAEDRYCAEDAAELVSVDYEPLDAVADIDKAQGKGVAHVHDQAHDNVVYKLTRGNAADLPDPFPTAPVVVDVDLRHPRLCGMSMEGSGVLASYDRRQHELTVVSSTQVPHLLRDGLAMCLGMKPEEIIVSAPDVGGAFGPKMQLMPEEVIVAYATRQLGRPVKWVQDRGEHLAASFHARDVRLKAWMATDKVGKILGLRAHATCSGGAYSAFPLTWALEPQTIGVGLCGPYHVPYYDYEGRTLATNTCPVGAYRGVGFPLCALATETLMDRVAEAIGADPAEVRFRNLITPEELPMNVTAGPLYDSGDYPGLLRIALEAIGYQDLRSAQKRGQKDKKRTGIGICCSIELTATNSKMAKRRGLIHVPGWDSCRLRLADDASIEALISTPSQGQSLQTTFARLLAEKLELDISQVRIVLGDTSQTPFGSGTFVSRSLVSGGGALQLAARSFRDRLCEMAAIAWQTDKADVIYANGIVKTCSAPERTLDLDAACELAKSLALEDEAWREGLSVSAKYDPPEMPVSAATHIAVVEADVETGFVEIRRYFVAEDCGPVIDQAVVDGQIRGAVAQAIGSTLFEEIKYDEDGQLLVGTLQDYMVPGTCDVPPIEITHICSPSPFTEGGFKGVAESGTIAGPAAIACAICDALGVLPDQVTLPLTPERVLRLAELGA